MKTFHEQKIQKKGNRQTKKKFVKIAVYNTFCEITFSFDKNVLAIVKEIEKRKYFSDTKSWRFPKEEFKNHTF